MNDTHIEQAFWSLVDELIDRANAKTDELDIGVVSTALVHAAARFNAFYLASSSASRNDLQQDRDSAIHDFGAEYKKCLAENLDDYIANYKVYLRSDAE